MSREQRALESLVPVGRSDEEPNPRVDAAIWVRGGGPEKLGKANRKWSSVSWLREPAFLCHHLGSGEARGPSESHGGVVGPELVCQSVRPLAHRQDGVCRLPGWEGGFLSGGLPGFLLPSVPLLPGTIAVILNYTGSLRPARAT